MLRIIHEPDYYTTVASPDDVALVLHHAKPGRYTVEEVSPAGKLLPSGHSCRRIATAIRHPDGHVTLDREPWPE
jgi:hypothetical protein